MFDGMNEVIDSFFQWAIGLLPTSPLLTLGLSQFKGAMGWLNFFVPFDYFTSIFGVFLGLFGVTIIFRAVLRYFGVLA